MHACFFWLFYVLFKLISISLEDWPQNFVHAGQASSAPIPCSAPNSLSEALSSGRGKAFFLVGLFSSLELPWVLGSFHGMLVSLLSWGGHEKRFALTCSIILRPLEILLYPRNGWVLGEMNLLCEGGQDQKLHTQSSCASQPVLRTLHGLTFLIPVPAQWDKPCHYPSFADGNSGTARLLPRVPGSRAESWASTWAKYLQSPHSYQLFRASWPSLRGP